MRTSAAAEPRPLAASCASGHGIELVTEPHPSQVLTLGVPQEQQANIHDIARSLARSLLRDVALLGVVLAHVAKHKLYKPLYKSMAHYAVALFGRDEAALKVTLRAGRTAWSCWPDRCQEALDVLLAGGPVSEAPELPSQTVLVALDRTLNIVTDPVERDAIVAKTWSKAYGTKELQQHIAARKSTATSQPGSAGGLGPSSGPLSATVAATTSIVPTTHAVPASSGTVVRKSCWDLVLDDLEVAIDVVRNSTEALDPETLEQLDCLANELLEVVADRQAAAADEADDE